MSTTSPCRRSASCRFDANCGWLRSGRAAAPACLLPGQLGRVHDRARKGVTHTCVTARWRVGCRYARCPANLYTPNTGAAKALCAVHRAGGAAHLLELLLQLRRELLHGPRRVVPRPPRQLRAQSRALHATPGQNSTQMVRMHSLQMVHSERILRASCDARRPAREQQSCLRTAQRALSVKEGRMRMRMSAPEDELDWYSCRPPGVRACPAAATKQFQPGALRFAALRSTPGESDTATR